MGLVLAAVSQARTAAAAAHCISNLRQIGAGFLQYALDNSGRFPDPFAMETSWERALRPYTQPELFRCRSDQEVYSVVGSSYDWRDTGQEETTLAGRMLAEVERANTVLAFEALPGWHARKKINAVFIDGSAQAMNQAECFADLLEPIRHGADGVRGPPYRP